MNKNVNQVYTLQGKNRFLTPFQDFIMRVYIYRKRERIKINKIKIADTEIGLASRSY